jgi:hypothetical protein
MTRLTDIITINITRETAAVSQTNFNVPLFIAAHTAWKERAREYTSLEAVADDFATSSSVYVAATKLFGQQIRPTKIVVGRRQIPSATVTVSTVTDATSYVLTINDVDFTFTSGVATTAILIAEGLKDTYDVSPITGITVTDNLDGTLTVASTIDWSIKVGAGMTLTTTAPTESWTDSLEAVQSANDTWYALTVEDHTEATILALAGAIEAKKKIYGTSSSDVTIKSGSTTDTFSKLQDLGYQRTFGIWSANANTEFPECALIGYQLQERPGSNTWAYKSLSGVTVSTLSDTEASNIKLKNGTTYENVGGLNVTVGAKMFGGEWIDVMVFVDWLEARLRERIWFRLANSKKIPYTQAGATILETEVRAQLREGIRVGGLADSPAPIVNVPDVTTIAPNLRAQRIFDGIEFEARLAGAIHFVSIAGRVTV